MKLFYNGGQYSNLMNVVTNKKNRIWEGFSLFFRRMVALNRSPCGEREHVGCSALDGIFISHLSLGAQEASQKRGQKVWKSQRRRVSSRTQHFLDITRPSSIRIHGDYDSIHKACASSSLAKSQDETEDMDTKPYPQLRGYWHLMTIYREKVGFL